MRQGYSAAPATDAAIRRMIKDTDGDCFEMMRSLEQNLTFRAAEKEFRLRGIEFGLQQMRSLRITDNDGLYSNLALLLSDQNPHTVKAAVFQGRDQMVFRDRREFGGSLMQQVNEVYDYIDLHNRVRSSFDKLTRIDVHDYPAAAIREALLNLIVHRDYSFSASALISIFDDRIEFISIGGLMSGVDVDDVMAGLSVFRNQYLANVYYRLRLIEAYGTGLAKIIQAYADCPGKPVVSVTKNSFKGILPNINGSYDICDEPEQEILAEPDSSEYQIMAYISSHGSITSQDAEKLLCMSASTALRLLRKMVKAGILLQKGSARSSRYVPALGG